MVCTKNKDTCGHSWTEDHTVFCKITGLMCSPWAEDIKAQQAEDDWESRCKREGA
jgi:hypothetical protein